MPFQLAPQRVALEVSNADAPQPDRDAFLEQLIVRRELSDNFCYYNSACDQVAGFADYLFTSELPGFLINLSWLALLLPAATAWFLIRLNHGNHVTSWIVIVLLFAPFAYLQFKQVDAHYNLIDEFSKKTYYSNSLYPWDYRLARSIAIEEFMASGILTESHTSTSSEREH